MLGVGRVEPLAVTTRWAAPAPDLLCKGFVAGRPNRVWLADITYIPTREGFIYLAFILDTHSQRSSVDRWPLT